MGWICSGVRSEAFEDFFDFGALFGGEFAGFADFALELVLVVLGVGAGGEEAAEAHGDGAGGDFGEACEDDHVRWQRGRRRVRRRGRRER